jgi:hypothetical protein
LTGASAGPQESTDEFLSAVALFIGRYVVVSGVQLVALALWVLHTHAIEAAQTTPYISITSAEKECGKTRLLEVLDLLVARPWFTGHTTAAALARKTEAERPTLLLDESDAAFKGDRDYAEALRGLLNTGYRRGGKTTLCVGQSTNLQARDFSTFGAKAIAGIGELPDTVASRSIRMQLKRRTPGEKVERFRRATADGIAAGLRERVARWAEEHQAVLAAAEPLTPVELGDRAAECWEPLLAIADLAGGGWSSRAHSAAIELSARGDHASTSSGVLLLGALRSALSGREAVPTDELLDEINGNDELPFGGWGERGLTARRLAALLRPYGVRPDKWREGDKTTRGYVRNAHLDDAFTRWLPPSPPEPPQAAHAPNPPSANAREHRLVADVADSQDPAATGPPPNGHATDCVRPREHVHYHHPHPATRRLVCHVCHPPPARLNGSQTDHPAGRR